jgi:acetyl-CoA/propionyl-CoA carboxylase carboxyl transferase subunit
MGRAGCEVLLTPTSGAGRRRPVVGLWHSGGARLREGVVSLHAVGQVFAIMTRASGRIPQISVVLGPAAGGAAYGPALTDIVVLGPDGRVFVTGPDVVRSVTGEDVDALRSAARTARPRPASSTWSPDHRGGRTSRAPALVTLLGDQGTLDVDAVADRDLAHCCRSRAKRAYDVHPLVADLLDDATPVWSCTRVGAEHRRPRSAGSAAAPSA